HTTSVSCAFHPALFSLAPDMVRYRGSSGKKCSAVSVRSGFHLVGGGARHHHDESDIHEGRLENLCSSLPVVPRRRLIDSTHNLYRSKTVGGGDQGAGSWAVDASLGCGQGIWRSLAGQRI